MDCSIKSCTYLQLHKPIEVCHSNRSPDRSHDLVDVRVLKPAWQCMSAPTFAKLRKSDGRITLSMEDHYLGFHFKGTSLPRLCRPHSFADVGMGIAACPSCLASHFFYCVLQMANLLPAALHWVLPSDYKLHQSAT